MRTVIGIVMLLAAPGMAWAQGQVRMDPRLTILLANAMARSGVVVTLADNDSPYSANISAVNGKNVCSPAAEADVRRFQDAADRQPGIARNFSYWQMSRTLPNGEQKVVDGDTLRAQNPGKFDRCYNLAIEIHPR